ncbi:MAG: Tn3 family transposase [Clostridium sp.]|uniref:Tn3 family transposase n=1 Tax=Clostridium sp. TaxID=1506 RepID=UPI0025BB79F5|nr:Tn3 family transposase [Clostridium sp.]MCE5222279.1 Tn3 family transposase [Clostridium sp.]
MATAEILLTEDQRLEFTQIPQNISEYEIAKYYTFSTYDIDIINKHRRDYNRLGFAVQLALLRNPGWSLISINNIPESVLDYISEQIKVSPKELELYAQRENTRLEHLQEIRELYGFKNYTDQHTQCLIQTLLPYAIENDNVINLIKLSINEIRRQKVILPGITTIEKVVSEVIAKADEEFIEIVNNSITNEQKYKLDMLINAQTEETKTKLGWLKEDQGHSSPKAFAQVIERLELIRSLQLELNIAGLHPNRIRQLSRLGSKYEPFSLRRFEEKKRYSILALYLYELSQNLIDKAIEIHDRQINILLSKGRKKQEELQKQNGKSLNEKIVEYIDIGAALIKARDENLDPFKTLESVMPWSKLVESVDEAKKLARPVSYDYLDLLDSRYSQLRRYTPILVKHLKFNSTNNASKPLIEAINVLNNMNENGNRKVPEDAPTDFISNRWNKCLYEKDGSLNRHYYEIATLSELKNRIRSGDVSVEGSKNFKDFEEYLIPHDEWNTVKKTGTRLAVNLDVSEYLQERIESLNSRLKWFSKNIDKLDGVTIENSKIHIDKLEKDTPPEAVLLSQKLYKMMPRIKLPDLLLEVSKWTDFDRNFIHASSGHIAKGEEKTILMAALMAMGTNIGLSKMADSTPGISYRQMANAAQWRLYDDAMKKAQSTLVNYHNKLFLSAFWGDGSTSSSDGMRVQVGVSSLHADANPHYGTGKGTTMYRFVSDQFSTFYTKVINTNARDAVHVIDGLLYHETDLNIEEHYTDTAGYTDQVFGLSHLLGFRFAPRIRDISEIKLYCAGKASEYPKIESILNGQIKIKTIEENFDDVLRMSHSIREGNVTGSLIMGKIGSYSRQNALATALREMGRIEKTIFILDYITNESLRRRIQRGLNKGEAMNGFARAIFFGKRGEFRERELQDQLQRASALNILINAISIWNTTYLQKAIDHLKQNDAVDESLLKHISPLGWEHINLLGEYNFDVKNILESDELRPLNINNP